MLINLTNFSTDTFDIKDCINITNNCSFAYYDGTVLFVSENNVIQFKDHLGSKKSLSVAYTKRNDKCAFDLEGICFNILPDGNHALSISHEKSETRHNHKYSLIVFKLEQT